VQSAPNTASISAVHCLPFLRELRADGVDARRQLALLGIRDLDEPGNLPLLTQAQWLAFLKLMELLAPDPDLGLRAGEHVQVTNMGLFGLLLRSSADGQSALERYFAYRDAVPGVLDADIAVVEGAIICRPASGSPSTRVFAQYFCASSVTCARQLHGVMEPLEVTFRYPQPADMRQHMRVFGDRVRFNAREDAVVYSSENLTRAMSHQDSLVAEVLQRHLAAQPSASERQQEDVRVRARRLIAEQLRRGQAAMPEIARGLGLTERTLRRQLEKLDSSYQSLLDEARRERAMQYLREGYTGPEVGRKLGFKGASAFRRAFRRWTGSSWSAQRDAWRATRSQLDAVE
jgi:AraC-like DNA-binding protein